MVFPQCLYLITRDNTLTTFLSALVKAMSFLPSRFGFFLPFFLFLSYCNQKINGSIQVINNSIIRQSLDSIVGQHSTTPSLTILGKERRVNHTELHYIIIKDMMIFNTVYNTLYSKGFHIRKALFSLAFLAALHLLFFLTIGTCAHSGVHTLLDSFSLVCV